MSQSTENHQNFSLNLMQIENASNKSEIGLTTTEKNLLEIDNFRWALNGRKIPIPFYLVQSDGEFYLVLSIIIILLSVPLNLFIIIQILR